MRELFFHILNGAAVRIGGAIKRIGSAPGAKYSTLWLLMVGALFLWKKANLSVIIYFGNFFVKEGIL